jgi:hypothetical protein
MESGSTSARTVSPTASTTSSRPTSSGRTPSRTSALAPTLNDKSTEQRERAIRSLADLDQRIARQIAAIESGVDPVLVGEHIRALKAERQQTEAALATLDLEQRQRTTVDLDDACAILEALPTSPSRSPRPTPSCAATSMKRSSSPSNLTATHPRYALKALVSSAFNAASDLDSIAATVAHKTIAGAGFEPATFGL